MELQAITGQLHIVEGHTQPGTAVPGILAQAAPGKVARNRERDFLFVHLTLSGPPAETAEMTNQLVQTISDTYYQSRGTVTSALRRAIINTNDWLLRHNLSSHEKRYGAITCAALHQGELYMVQVGEALAFLGHNFGVERLPAQTPERPRLLGQSAGADMRYFHHRLENGDMLLLAEPRLAHLPTPTFVPALVDTEVELGLNALVDIVGQDTTRLLLVEFADELPVDVPDVRQVTRPAPPSGPTPAPAEPRRQTTMTPPPSEPIRAGDAESKTAVPALPSVDLTAVEHSARHAASRSVMGLSRFTGWLADLLARLRPADAAEDEVDSTRAWTLTLGLAILIPILVGVVGTMVYLERGRVSEFAELKLAMGQNIALAEEAGDNAELARNHYYTVLTLANEARALNPTDNEVLRLQNEARLALDRLDGITRLQARPFYTYADGTQLTAVALGDTLDGGIFTLDRSTNAAYAHQTDRTFMTLTTPDPSRILFDGMAVGDQVVAGLMDLLWRPAGQENTRDGVAIVSSAGTLFNYDPAANETTATTLGLASEWQAPRAISTYSERLYVLDNGAEAIWKYLPEGEQFITAEDDRRIFFSDDPALGEAIDFDIYQGDASLVVVYADGRIRYFNTRTGQVTWDETDLLSRGLEAPFSGPTAVKIVGSGVNASIFVADPGTSRIVQISRVGTVLAQYRASDELGQELFASITDFDVPNNLLDASLRIFAVRNNVLYMATLD